MKWFFNRKKEQEEKTIETAVESGSELQNKLHSCQQAAEQGDPEAQYTLALMYLEGQEVKKNEKTAVSWLQKAVDQGHEDALRKLAWCYLYGHGVKQNLSESLRLSQIADGTECKVDMNKFGYLIRK